MALSVVVLPAPLEPEQRDDAALGHLERDVGDADQVAVAHFQILDHEQRRAHRPASAQLLRVAFAEIGLDDALSRVTSPGVPRAISRP